MWGCVCVGWGSSAKGGKEELGWVGVVCVWGWGNVLSSECSTEYSFRLPFSSSVFLPFITDRDRFTSISGMLLLACFSFALSPISHAGEAHFEPAFYYLK